MEGDGLMVDAAVQTDDGDPGAVAPGGPHTELPEESSESEADRIDAENAARHPPDAAIPPNSRSQPHEIIAENVLMLEKCLSLVCHVV